MWKEITVLNADAVDDIKNARTDFFLPKMSKLISTKKQE